MSENEGIIHKDMDILLFIIKIKEGSNLLWKPSFFILFVF